MAIDRLSSMPDDLLVHILRRLNQYHMREAAATAALSKRWRFVWTKLPLFYFSSDKNDDIGMSFARVHAALATRSKAGLEHYCGFSLFLSLENYDDAFSDDLVALLDFAAQGRVRDVDLRLDDVRNPGCSLPEPLYSYPSVIRLSLSDFKVVPPPTATVEWGLMTELSLYLVELTQQAIDQIVSGCPLLSRLAVDACSGFNRLDVRGRYFRELHVADGYYCSEMVEVSAPCMTRFNVYINPQDTTLMLGDVSSVERLRILFNYSSDDEKEMEMFTNNKQLFQLLQCITTLVLDLGFIQVVSNMREKGVQLPQFRVQHLIIQDAIDSDNITSVLALLESSPFLHKLAIYEMFGDEHNNRYWDSSVGADLKCDLLHLKSVEIGVILHPELSQELSFTLAQILLKRSPNLEEMNIIYRNICY